MVYTRRNVIAISGAALAGAVLPKVAAAQSIGFTPSPIYPDPAIQVLDPSFAKYRVASLSLEQVATGARWLEGAVWFGDGRYLLVSDVPNNRVMKYDETNETWSVFNPNSNYSNGHARDMQGRLLSCEHLTRRVTRTEYDGSITVLADNYKGKKLNSPNDIVCKSDGSIWFTDPPFGIAGEWEGDKAEPELPHSVYRISPDGKLSLVTDELRVRTASLSRKTRRSSISSKAAPSPIASSGPMMSARTVSRFPTRRRLSPPTTMAASMASASMLTVTCGAAGALRVRPAPSRKTSMA